MIEGQIPNSIAKRNNPQKRPGAARGVIFMLAVANFPYGRFEKTI
jgi:hypothetical protein